MAENKKSFILYADLIHTVKKLPKETRGALFLHILEYVNDLNPVIENDLLLEISFEPIKQQLKRDLKDWEGEKVLRSESGRLGGIKSGESRRKKKAEANEASASSALSNEANEAVTVNETVTVNVTDRDRSPQTLSVTNAETAILASPIQFEQICMKTGMNPKTGKEALRKFHLHLASKDEYPKTKSSVFAGFEKWLMNEKAFQPKVVDLKSDQPTGPKLKTI